jgi:hypothetical protein
MFVAPSRLPVNSPLVDPSRRFRTDPSRRRRCADPSDRGAVTWCRRSIVTALVTLLLIGSFPSATASGDEPPAADPPVSAVTEAVAAGDAVATDDDAAWDLVHRLGAPTFAQREQALGEILRAGISLAPQLRQVIADSKDPELVKRAEFALSQMTVDDLEARVAAFMTGDEATSDEARQWFPGWAIVRERLGNSVAVRELFVEVMKAHPAVTQSLMEGTAEREAAAEQAVLTVQVGMRQRGQAPTLADGVALLLPLTDPAVQVGVIYERMILSVFNRQYGTVSRDPQLWGPVTNLLDVWMDRSRPENRVDVLWYSMQWDLKGGRKLSLQTIEETKDIEMLQTALQTLSRFGQREDSAKLAPLLRDQRPAAVQMPVVVDNQPLQVTVADVALTTLAILNRVPPQDIGLRMTELHPRVGFSIENAGCTAAQAAEREAAVRLAERWCAGEPAGPADAKPAGDAGRLDTPPPAPRTPQPPPADRP